MLHKDGPQDIQFYMFSPIRGTLEDSETWFGFGWNMIQSIVGTAALKYWMIVEQLDIKYKRGYWYVEQDLKWLRKAIREDWLGVGKPLRLTINLEP